MISRSAREHTVLQHSHGVHLIRCPIFAALNSGMFQEMAMICKEHMLLPQAIVLTQQEPSPRPSGVTRVCKTSTLDVLLNVLQLLHPQMRHTTSNASENDLEQREPS